MNVSTLKNSKRQSLVFDKRDSIKSLVESCDRKKENSPD